MLLGTNSKLGSNETEITILKGILHGFELISGLKVNFSKSCLIPIGECEGIEDFATILECRVGSLPFSYLGLPLGAPFKVSTIWTPFIEKLENRLDAWRRNSLSKGERLVLIKSCLMSIPIYYLSLFPMPQVLVNRMEKAVRGFLWGETAVKKPFCLVRWNVCTKPKHSGGLSIRGFALMNKALLSKWIWRFSKEKTSLWRRVIHSKYGVQRGGTFPKTVHTSHGVGVWKNISKLTSFIHSNSSFELGDGQSIRFWIDKWCGPVSLQIVAPNIFRIVKKKQSLVAEVVKVINGQMTIQLQFYSPIEYTFMHEVASIHNLVFSTSVDPSKEDVLLWDDDIDKGYSVSAAYNKCLQPTSEDEGFPTTQVWRKGVPLRCQFFAWTAALNRIATFDLMQHRKMIWVNHCPLCTKDLETASHLLLHCTFASEVWHIFLRHFNITWVFPNSILNLFEQWRWEGGTPRGKIIWHLLPHAIIWNLGTERNARCFDGTVGSTNKVVMSIKGSIAHWCSGLAAFKDTRVDSFLYLFDRIIIS